MELHEYPRPANDTGIGVHWTVGFASAIGIGKIRDIWIPNLKKLGVKWVKIFNHDGAIDFAELLLAEDIMPIVRIFRPSPNPSTLDVRDVVHLDALIRAGVRYFEFNSEPDRDSEWKGGRVPANGLDLVTDNTIANLETILERGGMPGIPAVSNGSNWDLVGRIVAKGRKDLFHGPVWQAIHNYARNRPLDYPYDVGNQEGVPYTQRFYQNIAETKWGEDPWRGRSLADINRLRLDRANPGATIMDEHACWLAYEYFDARNRKHLGRSIPILSTECGHLIGEDIDPRFPATTPELHMAMTLEACRIMMGTTTRHAPAPDYYFCTAFWLLGNGILGSSSTWWENHAWYSERHPHNALAIVPMLEREKKAVRRWQTASHANASVGARVLLHGTVSQARDYRTVHLEQNGQEIARATLDTNNRYRIADVPAGNYLLRIPGTTLEQPISLPPDQEQVQINLDLGRIEPIVGGSTIQGTVRGGAGAAVVLMRAADGEDWMTVAREDGTFRFVELAAGTYTLSVQNDGVLDHYQDSPLTSPEIQLVLDGENTEQAKLNLPGWGYTLQQTPSHEHELRLRCRVHGHPGLQVHATLNDWRSAPVTTGEVPELGADVCLLSGLEPGLHTLTIEGDAPDGRPVHLEAHVQIERSRLAEIEFFYTPPAGHNGTPAQNSSIRGRVIGGCHPDKRLHVWLIDQQANRREQLVNPDCTFTFEQLAPGRYAVEVAGYADTARRTDIALDGRNTVHVELMVPIEDAPSLTEVGAHSSIRGRVPEGGSRRAKLVDAVGNEFTQVVEPNQTFLFDELPAGVYTLTVEGGYVQSDLTVDGESSLEVLFQPLELTWEYKASPAGSMPGYSVIRVEVEGMRGLPVYIWKEDWNGMMRRTGSKPEYGECSAEFSPLGPGIYMVEPEGLDVYADVELTGLEVVWVDFRRRAVPISPHQVHPLAPDGRPLAPTESAPAESSDPAQRSTTPAPANQNQADARDEDSKPAAKDSWTFDWSADDWSARGWNADDWLRGLDSPSTPESPGTEPDVQRSSHAEQSTPNGGPASPDSDPEHAREPDDYLRAESPDTWRENISREHTSPEDSQPGDTAPGDTAPGDTAPGDTAPGDTAREDTRNDDTWRDAPRHSAWDTGTEPEHLESAMDAPNENAAEDLSAETQPAPPEREYPQPRWDDDARDPARAEDDQWQAATTPASDSDSQEERTRPRQAGESSTESDQLSSLDRWIQSDSDVLPGVNADEIWGWRSQDDDDWSAPLRSASEYLAEDTDQPAAQPPAEPDQPSEEAPRDAGASLRTPADEDSRAPDTTESSAPERSDTFPVPSSAASDFGAHRETSPSQAPDRDEPEHAELHMGSGSPSSVEPASAPPVHYLPVHYLYVAEPVTTVDDQLALLHYVAQQQPQIGRDADAALQAGYVLILAPSLASAENAPSTPSAATGVTTPIVPETVQPVSALDDSPETADAPTVPTDTTVHTDIEESETEPEAQLSTAPSDPDAALRAFDWNLDDDLLLDGGDLEWPEWDTLDTSSVRAESVQSAPDASATTPEDALEDNTLAVTTDQDHPNVGEAASPMEGIEEEGPGEETRGDLDPARGDMEDDAEEPAEQNADHDTLQDHDTMQGQDTVEDDDDIYTAWIKATRRTQVSAAEPSSPNPDPHDSVTDNAASPDAGDEHTPSAPVTSAAVVHSSDENATKGNDPNSSALHAGAMLESVTALSEEIEALEARLRAAGVPFRRITGDLARALPLLAQG